MPAETPNPTGPPMRDHERRDANAAWIFGIVVFLFVFGISIHFILAGFQSSLKHTAPPKDAWEPVSRPGAQPGAPPGPRLQISPQMDLQSFRAREDAELHTYGWIDRTAGVVRVPIERAMDLVLQEGLPTQSTNQAGKAGPSSYQLMLQRPDQREPKIEGDK